MLAQMPILKGEDVADCVVYALSTPEHVQVSLGGRCLSFFNLFSICRSTSSQSNQSEKKCKKLKFLNCLITCQASLSVNITKLSL
jgi:hypothetical protein